VKHFELLFVAKINIPQACELAGMKQCEESWKTMREQFAAWCKEQPITHRFTKL
jgi:hypothetical protein